MLFVSGLSTGGGGATTSPLWHKPTQLRGSSNSPIPATTNRPVPPSFVLLTPIPKSWRGLANPAHKRRQPRTRVSCFPDPFSSPPAAETMVHVRLACLVCLRRTVRRTAILLGSAVRASMPSSRVEDGFVHRPTSVPSWDLPFNRGIHARFDSVRFPRDSGGREGGRREATLARTGPGHGATRRASMRTLEGPTPRCGTFKSELQCTSMSM